MTHTKIISIYSSYLEPSMFNEIKTVPLIKENVLKSLIDNIPGLKNYILENNSKSIDFENEKFYTLGTNANKFNGHINGNMHTVSNIELYGYDYLGLVGYNTGIVEGFKVNNNSLFVWNILFIFCF